MTDFLVTETRVIFGDDATVEELNEAKNLYEGKTIIKASSLYVAPSGLLSHQKDVASDLTARVRKLENTVALLMEAAKDFRKPSPLAEKIAAKHNAATVETVKAETPKDEAPIVAKVAVKPKIVEAAPEPVTNSDASERIVDRYTDYDKDELLRRVRLRGGDAKAIMEGYHARGRTNALRNWLRANPAKTKAGNKAKAGSTTVKAANAKAKAGVPLKAIAAKLRASKAAKGRTAH